MAELTERQQEIKALADQGKTPGEIAKELGITENAVYQHMRRMRNAGTKIGGGGNRRRAARPQARPAPAQSSEPRAMTPLQAIRARKHEIEVELREHSTAVTSAESALRKATEARDAALAKRAEEVDQLEQAEAALTGKPAPKPARRRSTAAKASPNGNGEQAQTPPPGGESSESAPAA